MEAPTRIHPVVPNRLREFRESAGITLRELARRSRVDKSMISLVERQAGNLRDDNKLALVAALESITGKPVGVTDIFFVEPVA